MSFCFYVLPFRCPPPSSDFGDQRVKSLDKRPVVLSRFVSLTVRHANCVSAMCLYAYSDCGLAVLITLPQRLLTALSVQGISE